MDPHLHFVTVAARDLDAARSFYGDGLGWAPVLDVPDEVIFYQVAPGVLLGLFLAGKFTRDLGLDAEPVPSGIVLSHNVPGPDEVRAVIAAMTRAGGSLVQEPQDSAFGGIFRGLVRDPNGIVWEVAHNPGWRILDDGSVTLG